MEPAEQENLLWIKQRYEYLVGRKFDIEDYIVRYRTERNVRSQEMELNRVRKEMIQIDATRTRLILKYTKPDKLC